MRNEEVRRFLCFTTGSSVLIANRISVTFNNLSGLARKPIAHTCGYVIELPTTYMSFLDFEQEFTAILAEDEYVRLANACSISHLSLFSILMLLIITVLIFHSELKQATQKASHDAHSRIREFDIYIDQPVMARNWSILAQIGYPEPWWRNYIGPLTLLYIILCSSFHGYNNYYCDSHVIIVYNT